MSGRGTIEAAKARLGATNMTDRELRIQQRALEAALNTQTDDLVKKWFQPMAKEMKRLHETIKEQASIIETLSTKIEAL
jgi:hypothetical protein